jgi:biotin carboxyl carrier protein
MKYTVKVAGKVYGVEIVDLNARPILARVDGEIFEVLPENNVRLDAGGGENVKAVKVPMIMEAGMGGASNDNAIFAPLPGNITEVFVKAGDEVQTGQVILIIEAMKMKNSIRSTRAGKLAAVLVSAGQTVAHKQALVEFEQ